MAEGIDLGIVLTKFNAFIQHALYLVAHNISFDEKVLGAEFLRNNMSTSMAEKILICTMQSSTSYCAINGPYGYKWPTLSELHNKLFNQPFSESHNASADIHATAKCFWEMRRKGLI